MATTATITPTLGSAPVTLQAGNYSAIDDRRFWAASVREGVLSGGSYQVIQRAAGANMTVDVASTVGLGATVQGDSVTAQGEYHVPPTAANVNVDIAAADATNPRNDLVVLEVKDDQHDAGGLNIARVRVITGTANASAAATDAPGANGTPALPSSCLLLALVRVTAAASSVTTAMINDRRPWAGGVPTFETSLPSPAADGQEIYYRADSTNGVIWHLRFRNAFNGGNATYGWEFIGGPPMQSQFATTETSASLANLTYGAVSANDPAVTVPLAGEYIVRNRATIRSPGAAATGLYLGIKRGSTEAVIDEVHQADAASPAANYGVSLSAESKITLTSSPDIRTVTQRYAQGSGGNNTVTAKTRSLSLTPVRVG